MHPNDTALPVLRTPNGSHAVERPCDVCGTPYLAPTARLAQGMARYCSRPCSFVGRSLKVTCTCTMCGADFQIKRSAKERGEGIYCSPACYATSRTGVIAPIADRFWTKVEKTDTCWLWTGALIGGRYGNIGVGNRSELAHRAAWTLATGDILTDDDKILHTCDVTRCVRNDDAGAYDVEGVAYRRMGHLFKATQMVNNKDARQKGRNVPPRPPAPEERPRGEDHWARRLPERTLRGAKNGMARLTIEEAHEIRLAYRMGKATQADLAAQCGVSRAMISLVVRGLTWHFNPQE